MTARSRCLCTGRAQSQGRLCVHTPVKGRLGRRGQAVRLPAVCRRRRPNLQSKVLGKLHSTRAAHGEMYTSKGQGCLLKDEGMHNAQELDGKPSLQAQ